MPADGWWDSREASSDSMGKGIMPQEQQRELVAFGSVQLFNIRSTFVTRYDAVYYAARVFFEEFVVDYNPV
jgi:hypothetical protein